MPGLAPGDCVEAVRSLMMHEYETYDLVAFWYLCDGMSKNAFATAVKSIPCDVPLVPIVVSRPELFTSANAVTDDLRRLMDEHREQISERLSSGVHRLAILLLTAGPIAVPQLASMMELPSWHPHSPGEIRDVPIANLERLAAASLRSVDVLPLAEALFHCDRTLIELLRNRLVTHRRESQAFAATLAPAIADFRGLQTFVEVAKNHLDTQTNPNGFRPTARMPRSFTGLAMNVFAQCKPSELSRVGKTLSQLIQAPAGSARVPAPQPALIATVVRGTSRPGQPAEESIRCLVVSMHLAAQLMHCCSHAGEYPEYLPAISDSVTADLTDALNRAAEYLGRAT